jgi:hypothetical protein
MILHGHVLVIQEIEGIIAFHCGGMNAVVAKEGNNFLWGGENVSLFAELWRKTN